VLGWSAYGGNAYSETSAARAHSGTNYFKAYQAFNGQVNYTGVYQDYISGPGATYAADGWAYVPWSNDPLMGQNAAWIEVTFRDANANVLALGGELQERLVAVGVNGISPGGSDLLGQIERHGIAAPLS